MAYAKGELHGIGGWLAFFMLTLGVFTPFGTLIGVASLSNELELAARYGDAWDTLIAWEWAMAGFTAALAWFAFARMMAIHNWLSVRITIGVLWVIAAIGMFGEAVLISLVAGVAFSDVFAGSGISFIRPLVYCTIWTLYLLQSQRVVNTYRPEPDDDGLAEIFE